MFKKNIAVIDLETTGFSAFDDEITEVGIVVLDNITGETISQIGVLVQGDKPIPENVVELTGITDEMRETAGIPFALAKATCKAILDDCIVVAHNAEFDFSFLKEHFDVDPKAFYDTLVMSREHKTSGTHKLGDMCEYYGISLDNAHRALDDAKATAELFKALIDDNKELVKLVNTLKKRSGRELRYRPTYTKEVLEG